MVIQAACNTLKAAVQILERNKNLLTATLESICKVLPVTVKVIALSAHELMLHLVKHVRLQSIPFVLPVLAGEEGVANAHPVVSDRLRERGSSSVVRVCVCVFVYVRMCMYVHVFLLCLCG
jgi:hypothetical protein